MTDNMTIKTEKKPIREDISLIKFILLSFVTFGIYDIFFLYRLINDIHELLYDEDDPLPKFPKYLLYSIFTLGIYNIHYWLKASDKMNKLAIRRRLDVEVSGGLIAFSFIISYFFSIVSIAAYSVIFKSYNVLAEDYNKNL